jgi:hypothetical protein
MRSNSLHWMLEMAVRNFCAVSMSLCVWLIWAGWPAHFGHSDLVS